MRQDKKSFRHESLQDAGSIREFLEAITAGIAQGKLTFSDEDDKIIMCPAGLLHLQLTASQEEDQHRIGIRVSWQVEGKDPKTRKSLRISTK